MYVFLYIFSSIYFVSTDLDVVIQRNDTSKLSNLPDVVYPMRSAESHGIASNSAINRKTVVDSVNSAATVAGTITIGQTFFHTDFPPEEYSYSTGMYVFALQSMKYHNWHLMMYVLHILMLIPTGSLSFAVRNTLFHILLVPFLLYNYCWNIVNTTCLRYITYLLGWQYIFNNGETNTIAFVLQMIDNLGIMKTTFYMMTINKTRSFDHNHTLFYCIFNMCI